MIGKSSKSNFQGFKQCDIWSSLEVMLVLAQGDRAV